MRKQAGMAERVVVADNGKLKKRIDIAGGQRFDVQLFAVSFRTRINNECQQKPQAFAVNHFSARLIRQRITNV